MNKNYLTFFLIVFLDMMGFSIIFPIFPKMLSDFILNNPESLLLNSFVSISKLFPTDGYNLILLGGVIAGLYSILQFIFSPIWGKLSDHLGRKNVLFITTLGSSIGYLIWIFSNNFELFFISRIILAIMSGNISVAQAGMTDQTSLQDRNKGMGMIGAGIGLGFIFGPAFGAFLSNLNLEYFKNDKFTQFPEVSIVAFLISIINVVLVFRYRESKIQELNPNQKSIHPFLNFLKFKPEKDLLFFSLLYFLFIFSFSGFEFTLNFYLYEYLLFSPKSIGLTFFYIGIIIAIVQGGLIRKLSGKVLEKNLVLFGLFFLFIGYSILYFSLSILGSLSGLFFLAIGSALIHPSLASIVSFRSKNNEMGENLGIFRSFGSLGRAFSPFVFSVIYFLRNPKFVFLFSFLCSLIIFLILTFKKQSDLKLKKSNA